MINDGAADPMPDANPDAARLLARRNCLTTQANPREDLDYKITVTRRMDTSVGALDLELSTIPDRWVLAPDALDRWIDHVAQVQWIGLGDLAGALLDDINNEMVPRWARVALTTKDGEQSLVVSDQQPQWRGSVPS